jgi:enterochelin esterase family protein
MLDAHLLIARAHETGTPVTEGDRAVFLWFGETAPQLVGDFNGWDKEYALPLEPIAPGVWARVEQFTPDAVLEYAYFTGRDEQMRVADPLSRRRVWNGIGGYNHILVMPQAERTPYTLRDRSRSMPCVTRHDVPVYTGMGSRPHRRVYLYHPPAQAEPVPLIVVYDGPDYLRRGGLVNLVHNLIVRGEMAPVALALLANGRAQRTLEYMSSDVTLGWLSREVLPFATGAFAAAGTRLIDPDEQPGAYGVMGASMGGLMALYTGVRLPGVFGKVIAQSGAFSFGYQVIHQLIELLPPGPIAIWQDCGVYEWLLEANRAMRTLLQERGYTLTYREWPAGHNYPTWTHSASLALPHLFPPKA